MKKTIVCLRWGDKYSPQYVNILYNMCKRHSTTSFDFICFTDDYHHLNKEIIVKPLPKIGLQGWWFKPWIFSKENGLTGDVLFLDLDLIVYDNIEKLWSCCPDDFVIIRDFTRHMNPAWKKFNSSVFRFNAEKYYWIWDDFRSDYKNIMNKNQGDQDYLYNILHDKTKFWPDSWIQSYKWEMREKSEVQLINGKRNFTSIKSPKLISECCIAVFHGDPNPDQVKDPWVIENWK